MQPQDTGDTSSGAAGFRTIAGQVDHRALPALLNAFAAGAAERLDRLGDAVAGDQREAFLQVLHALRGSAGSFGADGLTGACAALEERARAGVPLDDLLPALDALRGSVTDAVGGMRSVLVELGVR